MRNNPLFLFVFFLTVSVFPAEAQDSENRGCPRSRYREITIRFSCGAPIYSVRGVIHVDHTQMLATRKNGKCYVISNAYAPAVDDWHELFELRDLRVNKTIKKHDDILPFRRLSFSVLSVSKNTKGEVMSTRGRLGIGGSAPSFDADGISPFGINIDFTTGPNRYLPLSGRVVGSSGIPQAAINQLASPGGGLCLINSTASGFENYYPQSSSSSATSISVDESTAVIDGTFGE